MTTLPQAVTNFQLFLKKLHGIHYIIPRNATFATAIGADCTACEKAGGLIVP